VRILLVTQVFVPDMYANALLAGALCRHLLVQGHHVSVLAGPPSDVRDTESELLQEVRAARVHRLSGVHTKRRGLARRALDFGRLHLSVMVPALTHRRYDVVIALTLPPMLYVAALAFKATSRSRVVLWSMDCYPEVAVASGLLRRCGAGHRLLDAVNRRALPRLDATIALDVDMARLLGSRGAARVRVIPNWESDKEYFPVTDDERQGFRAELGVARGELMMLYLGNMGVVHEFGATLAALRRVVPRAPSLRVVFIGDGARRHEIEAFRDTYGRGAVVVRDFIPKARTRVALGASDLGLVTLRPEMVGLVTPSKILGHLAMGVPILFVGPRASEVGRIIDDARCGRVVEPDDVPALVDYLSELPPRRAELRAEGARGRDYFLAHREAGVVLPHFDRLLDEVTGGGRVRS
jgi:colanic acid biosynthesis glycosyl transferase WcaI